MHPPKHSRRRRAQPSPGTPRSQGRGRGARGRPGRAPGSEAGQKFTRLFSCGWVLDVVRAYHFLHPSCTLGILFACAKDVSNGYFAKEENGTDGRGDGTGRGFVLSLEGSLFFCQKKVPLACDRCQNRPRWSPSTTSSFSCRASGPPSKFLAGTAQTAQWLPWRHGLQWQRYLSLRPDSTQMPPWN